MRAGLLSARDRQLLEERLVAPLTDYHNETRKWLVAILITVPPSVGTEYTYAAIFADGSSESALHGVRGGEIPSWLPICKGPCEFTAAFRAKYPQIVNHPSVR